MRVEYAISQLAGLGSPELPSDLGEVSVGEEQDRTRLNELSNLARLSTCAPDALCTIGAVGVSDV